MAGTDAGGREAAPDWIQAVIRRRPVRPTSYVTRMPDAKTWQEILAKYRAGDIPRLGEIPKPASAKPARERR